MSTSTQSERTLSTRRGHSIERILAASALGLALFALASCRGDAQSRGRDPQAVPVTTTSVARKTIPVNLRAIGRVEAIAAVAITSRVGGELTQVHFREGQTVRAGDPLFTIDPRPYEAALRQAEAQLARDQAFLAKAESDVKRYADLVQKDFVTREQYDQITTNAASLRALVQADQANVDNARLQLAYCNITAPIRGRVGNLIVKPGNLVRAGDERALVTINQMSPVYVSFTLPGQSLPELSRRRGQRLTVSATLPEDAGRPLMGLLTFIDNAVDPGTSTILLKATFDNPDERLFAGQFVDVTLVLGEEQGRLVLPAAAVLTGQKGDYVFVALPDQTVELRWVTLARKDEKEAVIASGLDGSETVVTDGQIRLVPGARITSAPPAPPAEKAR
ncbi:MAG: efflux RND transporter periplasmic adaptor subunit [Vicinamibacteria bacterium]|jgi:multidrug efflux system membrane fusion protein|nr:efflux RND transporter periplasmic adaptor subunit [Vicinamibacteria bacterium]